MASSTMVRIDFLKYRVICLVFSLTLIGAFAATYFYRVATRGYAFTYSVDFTGGTQVFLKFEKPVSTSEVLDAIKRKGWESPVAREFSKQEILVRVADYSTDVTGLAENIRAAVQDSMPDNKVTKEGSETVGAGVGEVLRWKSIYAVVISIILMLFYIAWRFWSFAYALGAVAALMHDALVMLAVFLFLDREISINVIGAFLAVLGYSINDTIVIFAQIRNNAAKMRGIPMYDVVNISLNQTLRRTILTSAATTLTVLSMFLLGGEVLRDFSLALLVGIFFGTYSSIYMASPIMLLFYKEAR